jgi:hypothetical protein
MITWFWRSRNSPSVVGRAVGPNVLGGVGVVVGDGVRVAGPCLGEDLIVILSGFAGSVDGSPSGWSWGGVVGLEAAGALVFSGEYGNGVGEAHEAWTRMAKAGRR